MPIVIKGTLEEINEKLFAMSQIVQQRKVGGWQLFQSDESWDYTTQPDEKVCPVCQSLKGQFNGTEVPVKFQLWEREDQNVVYPNTHESLPEAAYVRGRCRCSLAWNDYLFVLLNRLFEEMSEVV